MAFAPPQSWNDLLTNETFVQPLNDLVEPAHLISRAVPPVAVPSLLHELAHHSCLCSAVGMTLAATDMKARRLAESGDEKELRRASTIVLTNRAVIELYRPLLEGLALFAEFDALPGPSRVVSRPLLYTARHTSGPEKASEWELALVRTLTDARQMEVSIERRRDLLSTGLRDPGGHQLGYQYVKTWAWWARQWPIFCDPDFVLFFLSEYFWNDYELAALLLDEHPQEELLPSKAVFEYCIQRLASVLDRGTAWEEIGAHFEQAMLDYELGPALEPGFHFGPASLPEAGQTAGRARLQEFFDALPVEDKRALSRRSLLHLASLAVETELVDSPEGRLLKVSFRDQPLAVAKLANSYSGTDGPATFDAFIQAATHEPCIAITVKGEVAHLSAPGSHQDFIARWGRQFPIARGASGFEPATVAISERDDGRVSRFGASFVHGFRDVLLSAYSRIGLAWIGPEGKERLLRAPAGFRSFLGADLTMSLAILASIDSSYAYLDEVAPGEHREELLAAAAAIERRLEPLEINPVSTQTEKDEEGRDRTAIRVHA